MQKCGVFFFFLEDFIIALILGFSNKSNKGFSTLPSLKKMLVTG